MTDTSSLPLEKPSPAIRGLLCFVLLGLVAMLITSLYQRFSNPHLVVSAEHMTSMQSPSAGGGSEIGRLMQAVQEEPTNVDALLKLTELLVHEQSWDAADNFAARALALDVNNYNTYYLLGVIKHNRQQHQEAAQYLEKALALKEDAHICYSLGVLYIYFLNDPAKGKEALSKGIAIVGSNASLKQRLQEELDKLSK